GWYTKFIFVFYLLALAGWIKLLINRPLPPAFQLTRNHYTLLSAFAGLLALLLLRNFTTFAAQYRYLWGANLAFLFCLIQGWRAWLPRNPQRLLPVIILIHIALTALAVGTTLWPVYHP